MVCFARAGEVLHVLGDQASLGGVGVGEHALVVGADQVWIFCDGDDVVTLRWV
jgi:hypothetical protein